LNIQTLTTCDFRGGTPEEDDVSIRILNRIPVDVDCFGIHENDSFEG
jgi:hypothetical protein